VEMNKKFAMASLAGLLATCSFAASANLVAPVTVDGGTINFTGSLVAAPCSVDNGATGTGQTVALGQVPTNHFAAKGDTSTPVPFNIKLIGCDLSEMTNSGSYTSAAITFHGNTVDAVKTDLAVQGASGASGENLAKNIGIEILQNNKPVTVDGSAATEKQTIQAGNNDIPFTAQYVAEAADVSAGAANAAVDFSVTYN
jgi:major type 1 subunit fimbrin (pilin)